MFLKCRCYGDYHKGMYYFYFSVLVPQSLDIMIKNEKMQRSIDDVCRYYISSFFFIIYFFNPNTRAGISQIFFPTRPKSTVVFGGVRVNVTTLGNFLKEKMPSNPNTRAGISQIFFLPRGQNPPNRDPPPPGFEPRTC